MLMSGSLLHTSPTLHEASLEQHPHPSTHHSDQGEKLVQTLAHQSWCISGLMPICHYPHFITSMKCLS